MILKRVRIVGTKYVVVFKNEAGDTIEQTTTADNYAPKGSPRGVPPPRGYRLSHAISDFVYDTPSGSLEPGTYAVASQTAIVKRATDTRQTTLPSADVVLGVLTPAGHAQCDARQQETH